MRSMLILLFISALAFACSPAEQAEELSALSATRAVQVPRQPEERVDIEALQKCCDDTARAMGAECCQQLDRVMQSHASRMSADAAPSFQTGRPVQVSPEIAALWPKVKLRFGPTDAEGTEVMVEVGQKLKLTGTSLEVELLVFVPAFNMSGSAITSNGAEATNPAAKVVIREEGKPDWTGWLFANMPEVHSFPHETMRVVLLGGVKKE